MRPIFAFLISITLIPVATASTNYSLFLNSFLDRTFHYSKSNQETIKTPKVIIAPSPFLPKSPVLKESISAALRMLSSYLGISLVESLLEREEKKPNSAELAYYFTVGGYVFNNNISLKSTLRAYPGLFLTYVALDQLNDYKNSKS